MVLYLQVATLPFETKLRAKIMITENTVLEQKLQIWAMPQSKWHMEIHPEDQPFYYEVRTDKPWASGAVKVHEFDITATVPSGVDLTKAAVNTLEDAIAETRANAEVAVKELKEQIQALLMLDHKPAPDLVVVEPCPFEELFEVGEEAAKAPEGSGNPYANIVED